ncbi:MAG: PIN domain-containing protein [Chloroflexi bacterium]|nr:PIN domain-containing protein [Chloroflexota bacterium]
MTTLREVLPPGAVIAIDTSPFIYSIEGGSAFDAVAVELFEHCIATARNPAVTTVITLAEVLVGAFQVGRDDLAAEYRDLLQRSANLELLDLNPVIAERGAELRARYSLRLPDALQVAAALFARAGYFVTNDDQTRRVSEITVIVLADIATS